MPSNLMRWGTRPTTPRLHKRRVDVNFEALSITALAQGMWLYHVEHGGEVANSYGYPASTEVCIAVVAPDGRCAAWHGRAPANKVTERSAAVFATDGFPFPSQHFGYPEDYWDLRVGDDRRDAGRRALQCLWRYVWTEPFTCLWCTVHQ